MTSDVHLHSFKVVLPAYSWGQKEIVEWTLKAHKRAWDLSTQKEFDEEFLSRFCLNENHIKSRYYECPDVDEHWESHKIYRLQEHCPKGVDSLERNRFFGQRASEIFEELYCDRKSPEHLIHVTCTGYLSPSPGQVYFEKKDVKPSFTNAYHMGCYAAMPAVRMASSFLRCGDHRLIDVVHTEMCGLHMDPTGNTPEQMVVQSLFADGHIVYAMTAGPKGKCFRVKTVLEKLLPDSTHDMTWIPAGHGMLMSLSKDVPGKVGKALPLFLAELFDKGGYSWDILQKNGIFAIHPGGPKIIESAQRILELTDHQVEFSKQVLKERGNMSSATLPHVWNKILASGVSPQTPVISLAFGPGLTIFGAVFEVVEE